MKPHCGSLHVKGKREKLVKDFHEPQMASNDERPTKLKECDASHDDVRRLCVASRVEKHVYLGVVTKWEGICSNDTEDYKRIFLAYF